MYFLMLIVRFMLGTRGGFPSHPQLVTVRAGGSFGQLALGQLALGQLALVQQLAHRVPNNWNVASGHLRIHTPIQSPIAFRQPGSRSPTVLEQRGGRFGRLLGF